MATKEVVTKVWIAPGCIVCDACETTSPDVFEVTEDTCLIRPAALEVEFTKPRTQEIIDAAQECPVDVIKFETITVEAAEGEVAATPAAAAEAKTVEHAPVAKAAPVAAAPKEPTPPAASKSPTAAPKVSVAGEPDPAIAALLRAATSRGGNAGLLRRSGPVPESVEELRRKNPSELPPDARQARIMGATKKAADAADPSRREFVGGAALAVGWVAFGVGAGVAVGPAFGRFMMPNALEEPDPRVRVGPLQRYLEMKPGEVNEDFKPQGIWMIREEERIAALNIICTHLGCIPNWLANDRKFKCPCHGSGYKPNGINFEGPTPRPLERFRVMVEDGIVVVDKSKKFQYELGQWTTLGSFLAV